MVLDSHLADFSAYQPIIDAGGFSLSDYKSPSPRLGATVRNIIQSGESGSLTVNFDKVSFDGSVYDDFNASDLLDTNKWEKKTFEF